MGFIMTEKKVPCKAYIKRAMCECGGEMKYDTVSNIMLATSPPQYPHVCEICGKRENLLKVYPSVEYEEKKGCKLCQ